MAPSTSGPSLTIRPHPGDVPIEPWTPGELGPSVTDSGVGFGVFSSSASAIDLCLFDGSGEQRSAMHPSLGGFWHGFVPGIGPGAVYGFRADGPWDPADGQRFDRNKLLIDPYARAISGEVDWRDEVMQMGADSAPFVPRSVVVDERFDWGDEAVPVTPIADSVIYEVHVKGFTQLMEHVPDELRGRFAGMAHPAAVGYLKDLGVSAVQLLPIHHHLHDLDLHQRGLRNYWGYQSLGWFAPHGEYSSSGDTGAQVNEFKQMVKALHQEGIEVILDVVYNHSAEGDEWGPTFSLKGLDNSLYYRLSEEDRSKYVDFSGVGNTLKISEPMVMRLVTDSLRYWVEQMHVDGFRFDLAVALGRDEEHFDQGAAFFDALQQDPVLRDVKLIAEPWDLGPDGYQLGGFPPPWSELNGHFRDTVRDFWRGEGDGGSLVKVLTGSDDIFSQRSPDASINYVTSHDGFTVRDVVSYEQKHNEANGHDNTDGQDHNRSWNCGIEGDSDDHGVLDRRFTFMRSLLGTLLLARGVPKILAGDEIARTQQGNNNAYCQDNEVSWIDWSALESHPNQRDYVASLLELRKRHRVLRLPKFPHFGTSPSDDAVVMDASGKPWWPEGNVFQLYQNGAKAEGSRSLLLCINGDGEPATFTTPTWGIGWTVVFDTALSFDQRTERDVASGAMFEVSPLSILVLASL